MKELYRRIERTLENLSDCLIDMILERGYDSVTVRDLAQRAGVSHSTFYRHYRNTDEL